MRLFAAIAIARRVLSCLKAHLTRDESSFSHCDHQINPLFSYQLSQRQTFVAASTPRTIRTQLSVTKDDTMSQQQLHVTLRNKFPSKLAEISKFLFTVIFFRPEHLWFELDTLHEMIVVWKCWEVIDVHQHTGAEHTCKGAANVPVPRI